MNDRSNRAVLSRLSVLFSAASIAAVAFSCSSKTPDSSVDPNGTGAGPSGGSGTGSTPPNNVAGTTGVPDPDLGMIDPSSPDDGPCTGLACQVPKCDGGVKTTISGRVYDPAGKVPLYNVLVYVPNGPVPAFTDGVSCDRCGAKVMNPVTSAVTDETGAFVLPKAPAGMNIPLVIQVGKWRRQIVIPQVNPCVDTALTDPQVTRLPRNKAEGDLPHIAISTGAGDQMECLPLRMGVDPAEFTNSDGNGRIHLFTGDHAQTEPLTQFDADHGGTTLTESSTALWANVNTLKKYDIVILSCEADTNERAKTPAMRQAMYDYANEGGRVFASHLHSVWFAGGPDPLPSTGTWRRVMQNPPDPSIATIDQSFPKGAALAKWLVNVQASTMLGQMSVAFPRNDLQAVNKAVATEWITVNDPDVAVQYMSFNTPIGAAEDKVCGREVFTDLHVASVDVNSLPALNAKGFPASCEMRDLSAQEKAVSFMLFDLSACVQSDVKPPEPPK
jgi:hypothetical protein